MEAAEEKASVKKITHSNIPRSVRRIKGNIRLRFC